MKTPCRLVAVTLLVGVIGSGSLFYLEKTAPKLPYFPPTTEFKCMSGADGASISAPPFIIVLYDNEFAAVIYPESLNSCMGAPFHDF